MNKSQIVRLSALFAKKWYEDEDANKMYNFETYVEDHVSKYLDIAQKINAVEHNLLALQKKFNAEKDMLRNDQREAWKLCDHPIKTYHPDASGNNDSWYECEVCGKEL